jgi:hypothetical protein
MAEGVEGRQDKTREGDDEIGTSSEWKTKGGKEANKNLAYPIKRTVTLDKMQVAVCLEGPSN